MRSSSIVTIQSEAENIPRNSCCCCCCGCLRLDFMSSEIGIIKILEVILGWICHYLVYKFGIRYSASIGSSYEPFLTIASWCFMTTSLLIFCYVISPRAILLIRQSVFETVFNTVAAFSYIFACSYLGYVVHKYLPPSELLQSMIRVYPAYILSSFIALIYGLEAWKSWIIYRKFN
ncbi:hypothetical protein WA026_012047 [Henosepilachna vigintioctopunctata]|uniref:MARVEL domain-containing protein n=1 Tax=Henosepilachna vigintioctopunctata TaxID=420089 RepID=A0AAW1V4T2_9CUCU